MKVKLNIMYKPCGKLVKVNDDSVCAAIAAGWAKTKPKAKPEAKKSKGD